MHLYRPPFSPIFRSLTLFAASLLSFGSSYAAVILDETFEPGSRLGQKLPDTGAWYASSQAASVSNPAKGILTLATGPSSAFLLTHFSDGAPLALEVGETLDITFTFSIDGVTDLPGSLRVGAFDSAGSRTTTDGQGPGNASNPTYSAYTGYAAIINPGATTGSPLDLRKRNKSDNLLITGLKPYTRIGKAAGSSSGLKSHQTYTGKLTLFRKATGVMDIGFSITGEGLTGLNFHSLDKTSPVVAFDTLAIAGMARAFNSFTLSRVTIKK